jgi:AcrR family transcriptional regulator
MLFSESGYKEVSMRDIAKAVGINASSLYNHYASKEDILNALYSFFAAHWEKDCPKVGELRQWAETDPPREALMKLNFQFDSDVQEIMNRIVSIALRQMRTDPNSERFVREHMQERLPYLLETMLNRMIELERIEPVDMASILRLMSYYSISATLFQGTPLQIELNDWLKSLQLVFLLIKPKGVI